MSCSSEGERVLHFFSPPVTPLLITLSSHFLLPSLFLSSSLLSSSSFSPLPLSSLLLLLLLLFCRGQTPSVAAVASLNF